MAYTKADDLPSEIKEKLPQGAQQIFMAAFNSAQKDGLSEQGAEKVAWNSVKQGYEQGPDGNWQHKPEGSNSKYKGTQTGGN